MKILVLEWNTLISKKLFILKPHSRKGIIPLTHGDTYNDSLSKNVGASERTPIRKGVRMARLGDMEVGQTRDMHKNTHNAEQVKIYPENAIKSRINFFSIILSDGSVS